MGDVVGCEEGRDQMRDGAGLTTVRTKLERVQSSLPGRDKQCYLLLVVKYV